MRMHPRHPNVTLLEADDLEVEPAPSLAREHLASARQVLEWAQTYLRAPHPELGRGGPVCPYVASSLKSSLFFLAIQRGSGLGPEAVAETVGRFRDWFGELEPRQGKEATLKTILVLFPDVATCDAPAVIDATQQLLKPSFVQAGLMIGQFHPGPPEEPGLWNPDFRPLRSPVPLLAIRHMVATDLPFLMRERASLTSYVARFGDSAPARYRRELAAAADAFGLDPSSGDA